MGVKGSEVVREGSVADGGSAWSDDDPGPEAAEDPGPAAADDEPAADGPDNDGAGVSNGRIGRTFVLDLGERALLQVEGPERTVVAVGSVDGRSPADTAMSMGFQVDPSEVVLGPRRHA